MTAELQQCFDYVKSLEQAGTVKGMTYLVDSHQQIKLHYCLGVNFYVHLSLYRFGISTLNALTKEQQEEMEAKYEFQFIQRNYGYPICVALDEKWTTPSISLVQFWSEKILSKERLPDPPKPVFISYPTETTLTAGVPHQFEASASGVGDLTYAWYKDNQEIPFKFQNFLYIGSPTGTDVGNYKVEAKTFVGNVFSPTFGVHLF